jgi:hypothetical protein
MKMSGKKSIPSCSLPQRGPFTGFLGGDERGGVIPIVAVCLAVIIGLAALAIDLGWLFVVKGELQNAADAAALAGVVELVQGDSGAIAKNTGVTYATEPSHFRLTSPPPAADGVDVTILGPETLQVRVGRTAGTTAGAVPTIFARIWGTKTVDVDVLAVATVNHRVIGVGPGILLPIGVKDTWLVDEDGDGLPDPKDIYPHIQSESNFGLIDLDGGENSNDDIKEWIEYGYDDYLILPEDGCKCLKLEGDPGISGGSLETFLESQYGNRVLLPVFNKVTGAEAGTLYYVIGFVGVIITDVKLTGDQADRHINVTFTEFVSTKLILGGEGTDPNPTVSAPVLIQ